ncbi:Outer membrane protein OmpA [Spirosomataceae bacterium TFI 002]|nr:Outer membrane protein OmpA [Spirosomataceae bacterium TFI 002]
MLVINLEMMLKMKKYIAFLLVIISSQIHAQKLEKLGSAINTEYNELHPVIAPDGETLFFMRESHPSNNYGKNGSNDVWFSNYRSDGRWSVARKMPNTVNKDKFNDLFCITPDGNTILIRGVYDRGRKQNEIGISKCVKTKSGWGQPEKLDIPKLDAMCKGQFLSAYLTNTGKTLILGFSEKKNSAADDLFVSFLDKNGNWSKPESLGNDINTNGIETTPFMASDDRSLYFASDRKGGVGGVDIWVAKRKGRSWNSWSEPVNLGEIINTPEDEYYFSITSSGEYAYLTTKSNTIGKGDIVRFKLKEDKVAEPVVAALQGDDESNKVQVKDLPKKNPETENPLLTSPNPIVMLSGKVVDSRSGNPIEAKIIYETFPDGEEIGIANTDPTTGEYKIVLPYGQRYNVRAIVKDYISIGKTIDVTDVGEYKEIKGENLEVAPILVNTKVPLNNIFFQFGKATLAEESFLELNRLVDVLNDNRNMVIEVQGHTDNVGSDEANLKLSQDRANSVRDYLVSKGIPLERVQSVGYGESKPVASNNTTEGQAKNRRVEFEIVKK